MRTHYPDIALHVPTILMPRPGVSLPRWSVIACDQHTSEPAFWEETERLVGDSPSTLRMVLPESRLRAGGREAAIAAINRRMGAYLADGVLEPKAPGFMLVERDVGRAQPRRGLLVALDLEAFDYRPGARALIRSTEGTDPDRLPPRTAVRRRAPLETPHILVLIDDPGRTVVEPLFDLQLPLEYDFELLQGGGRVRGWHVARGEAIDAVAGAIRDLRRGDSPFLYALGDGNHSFAAARAVWDELKASGAAADHPARHALVELVNVHDAGLEFAPIHRLLDVGDAAAATAALDALAACCPGGDCERRGIANPEDWRHQRDAAGGGQRIAYRTATEHGVFNIAKPRFKLAVATLQTCLDNYRSRHHPQATVDYIHGDQALAELAARPGRIGFYLPGLDKHDLFPAVARDGATPPKTFSLGEAHEKRYYLECRRLAPEG